MPYVKQVATDLEKYGYQFSIKDKSKATLAVKKAFLKDNSLGHQITLYKPHEDLKIVIKLEIDSNPPPHATYELKKITFPETISILNKDLPSSFSGKCNAILCRAYLKGRDWYDFLWYVRQNINPNLTFFESGLRQCGPWSDVIFDFNKDWIYQAFKHKINSIDWAAAARDVEPFLSTEEQNKLPSWNKQLFLEHLDRMMNTLN